MTVLIPRDKALTVPLLSTCGTATLLSRDGHEVKVPLAPLLGGSPLARSIVAESNLHPGIHGPLNLSFEVAADVLVSVGNMLSFGEANVKEENIDEVKQVLTSLGVKANLSQRRNNIVYKDIATNEADIKLEIVFEPMSDEETPSNHSNVYETKNKLLEVEASLSQSDYEHAATNEEDGKLEKVFESMREDESDSIEVEVNQANNILLKECAVNKEKIGKPPAHSYRINKKEVQENTVKKCDLCEYMAKSASDLKKHMRSRAGEKPYSCPLCNYSCSSPSKLRRHSRTHTGTKPYKCTICNYCCSNFWSLKVHNRTHTEEKPYTCKICNSSFTQSGNFRRHCRIHSGDKPFKCKICDYSCSDPSSFQRHNRMHSGEKPYSCKICTKSFSRLSNLRKHATIHA